MFSRSGKWIAPEAGILKCNVDGSWKEGKGGIGVIVRNNLGEVVLSGIFPKLFSDLSIAY